MKNIIALHKLSHGLFVRMNPKIFQCFQIYKPSAMGLSALR